MHHDQQPPPLEASPADESAAGAAPAPESAIRFRFPSGTQAGVCLHGVLEEARFDLPFDRRAVADRLVGDSLVQLHSAMGQHDAPRRALAFARDRHWIAYRTGHLQLLGSPAVTQQLLAWLTPPA